jgi:hypothetical protein
VGIEHPRRDVVLRSALLFAPLLLILLLASGSALLAQAFGGEFQVNTYTPNNQTQPAIGDAANGDFVVVWTSGLGLATAQDGSGYGVFGQRFTSTGLKVGAEFQVNSTFTGDQGSSGAFAAPIGVADDGAFVVAWRRRVRTALLERRDEARG